MSPHHSLDNLLLEQRRWMDDEDYCRIVAGIDMLILKFPLHQYREIRLDRYRNFPRLISNEFNWLDVVTGRGKKIGQSESFKFKVKQEYEACLFDRYFNAVAAALAPLTVNHEQYLSSLEKLPEHKFLAVNMKRMEKETVGSTGATEEKKLAKKRKKEGSHERESKKARSSRDTNPVSSLSQRKSIYHLHLFFKKSCGRLILLMEGFTKHEI